MDCLPYITYNIQKMDLHLCTLGTLNPALSAVLQDTARIAEATDAVCCMYAE